MPTLTSVTFNSLDSDIDASLPTYSTASVSASSIYTGSAPDYDKLGSTVVSGITSFEDFFNTLEDGNPFGDSDPGSLVISSFAPSSPSVSSAAVSFSQPAPTFTPPMVTPDFAKVTTYIDSDEDVELASAKLTQIGAQLSEYQSDIQKEVANVNTKFRVRKSGRC